MLFYKEMGNWLWTMKREQIAWVSQENGFAEEEDRVSLKVAKGH